jgi:hypothetical protein
MKRGHRLLSAVWLCVPLAAHAFTLDIASTEVMEFGQGPRSIFVPGYGEVTFESGLDGELVLDSAYASTDRIEVPAPSEVSGADPSIGSVMTAANPDLVKISNRISTAPIRRASSLQLVEGPMQNASDGLNAVPEAASATLGLLGMLMLFLRRNTKKMHGRTGRA